MSDRTITITEAAKLVGVTRKTIERKVERGALRSVLDASNRRRIPVSELGRHYELPEPGAELADVPDAAVLEAAANGGLPPGPRRAAPAPGADMAALLDRLEKQAQDLGRYRLLAEQSETTRVAQDELRRELEQAREDAAFATTQLQAQQAELRDTQRRLADAERRRGLRGLLNR